MIDMIGTDAFFMFATDYPHWDFDSPAHALSAIRPDLRPKLFHENARAVYRF